MQSKYRDSGVLMRDIISRIASHIEKENGQHPQKILLGSNVYDQLNRFVNKNLFSCSTKELFSSWCNGLEVVEDEQGDPNLIEVE